MEQTISKFPNPFGSVAPHKLFAWGLSATVGYGFAIWVCGSTRTRRSNWAGNCRADAGIRSARTALRCRPAPPPVSGRRDGALRRLALRTDSVLRRVPAAHGSTHGCCRSATARFRRCKRRCRREVRPFWAASPFCAAFEHDLGLAGILPCDAREGPPQHRRRRMLCPARPSCSQSFFKAAAARLALELVAKTTKESKADRDSLNDCPDPLVLSDNPEGFAALTELRRRSISKRDLQRNRSRTARSLHPQRR